MRGTSSVSQMTVGTGLSNTKCEGRPRASECLYPKGRVGSPGRYEEGRPSGTTHSPGLRRADFLVLRDNYRQSVLLSLKLLVSEQTLDHGYWKREAGTGSRMTLLSCSIKQPKRQLPGV